MHHAIAWIFELVLRRLLRISDRRTETSRRPPTKDTPDTAPLRLCHPWLFVAAVDVALIRPRAPKGVTQ
ncbi:hypothetical protein [Streptomyces sp. SAJ15]|uniref:hypothetical protein n=1 Tax=Streptomyces sp. SAJ15 TaxID=2011095 RepID=UPI0011848934|nr:hypothetical protein [Streptomyces sp. SAJ15]TVL91954.1 hypothetical protein CD790_14865 [Streptomyces sp. SAJ15]